MRHKSLVFIFNSNLMINFTIKAFQKVQKTNLWRFKESLILAQDERWRDALHMQVVREFLI